MHRGPVCVGVWGFFSIGILSVVAVAADVSIKPGDQVIRLNVLNDDQLKSLEQLDLDVWSHEFGIGPIDVHASQSERQALAAAGFTWTITNPDLLRSFAEEQAANALAHRGLAAPFDSYLPLADIYTFMDNLEAARPDLCQELAPIGNSIESRPIRVWRFSGPGGGEKPGVFYHGMQHAREWITAPTVMYLANYLIMNYDSDLCLADLMNRTEFFLAPVVNPDGYAYTWIDSSTRLWRKNRRNNGGGSYGVDLNRNWAYGWGGGGSSGTPSSDTYRGTAPFSEPETAALSAFISARPNIKSYMDYHSYSQLILWPFGNVCAAPPPPDDVKFANVGNTMQSLIASVHGSFYEPGPICQTLYQASGGSVDWTYGTAGRLGYTIELRPASASPGFLLPPDQIIPNCQENLPAILFLSRYASSGVLLDLAAPAPSVLAAGQSTPIRVTIVNAQESYVGGSGRLYYRVNPSDPYSSVPLQYQSGSTYSASLPAFDCGQSVDYYVTAGGSGGFLAVLPCNAPSNVYSAVVQNITPPQVVHSYPLNSNPGWTLDTGWAFGVPTGACGDPTSGYSGSNVYGYNLAGCYGNNITTIRYLTTTPFDCSNLTNTQLRFRRWLGVESAQFDHANIQASDNGTNWTTIWNFSGATLNETAWSLQIYDLSAIADGRPAVRIRWGMGTTDGSVTYSGWNIDDVEILGVPVVSCEGVIPGDVSLDAKIDGRDIAAFIRVLLNPTVATSAERCAADMDTICGVTLDDLDPFIALLLAQ